MQAAQVRRDRLRSVMLTAWSFKRTDADRTFADCLRGAWRWTKRMAETASKFMKRADRAGGIVRFSADLTRSPIRSRLYLEGKSTRHRRTWEAAYTTSRVGR